MVSRKALWIPAVASGGLLVLLIATSCGNPDAAPKPVAIPTITTSPQVSETTPENNTISVKPTTPAEPTVEATTEPPPETSTEPPVQVLPVPPVETTDPAEGPARGPFVTKGAPCYAEGALGVSPRGRPLVCSGKEHGHLTWQPL